MQRLRLHTFGTVSLDGGEADEAASGSPPRRRLALLAVLAVAGERGRSRDTLHALLWPEATAERARRALEQLLYSLRTTAGAQLFVGVNPFGLNPEAIESDVADFERACRERRFADAVALYRGPFLDGFFLSDAPEFERWCETERARLAAMHRQALQQLAIECSAAGDERAAVEWWRRLAADDPFDAAAAEGLIRALAQAGDHVGALRHADGYAELLRRELDTGVGPAIAELVAELRANPGRVVAAAPPAPPAASVARAPRAAEPVSSANVATSPPLIRGLGVVALALVVVATVGLAFSTRERASITHAADDDVPSLAVLPFDNVGRDSLTEYFADGMTDELASALALTPGLRVVGRRSAYVYKNATLPADEVGRALGVRYLLDGAVRREADRVRVTAQLIGARDGISLWAGSFEGNAREVFALQDSITMAIVGALRLTLATSSATASARRTDVLEAHDRYLQGRYEAEAHSREGLLRALSLYESAAAADSGYALPWVGLADAYGWLADSYYPAHEAYAKARSAVARALAMEPDLAEAHAVLGWIQLAYDWDGAAAERTLRRAVELDSLSPLVHSNYSFALLVQGNSAAALREIRRALALDPLSPALSANLEWHLLMQRRYDEVLEQHRVTRQLDSTYFFNDSWAGVALRSLGRHEEAIAAYREAEMLEGRPLPGLAIAYVQRGDTARARQQLDRVLDAARRRHVPPELIAQALGYLGEADRAFEFLERAHQSRSHGLRWIAFDPRFDPLRRDARFAAFAARVQPR